MIAGTLPMSVAPTVPRAITSRAVGRLAVRQIRRGALIVAVVCAVMSAGVAAQYQTMFQGSIAESGLQALAEIQPSESFSAHRWRLMMPEASLSGAPAYQY